MKILYPSLIFFLPNRVLDTTRKKTKPLKIREKQKRKKIK